jgi:hypothetical protein
VKPLDSVNSFKAAINISLIRRDLCSGTLGGLQSAVGKVLRGVTLKLKRQLGGAGAGSKKQG